MSPNHMTLEETMKDALNTMRAQQNRIAELEQQLQSMQEANIRFIERLQRQIQLLQERVQDLLDPEERHDDEKPTPNSGAWYNDHSTVSEQ